MNRRIATAVLLLGLVIQETAGASAPAKKKAVPAHAAATRPAPGQKRFERMSKELSLTPAQKAKLRPVVEERARQMRALRDNKALSDEQRDAKAKKLRKAFRARLRSVLTPAQQKKTEAIRARDREQS
jgi:Spy/CpxP family protein refolding chaperone